MEETVMRRELWKRKDVGNTVLTQRVLLPNIKLPCRDLVKIVSAALYPQASVRVSSARFHRAIICLKHDSLQCGGGRCSPPGVA
ncbi:hypothetical protein E2C01_046990 [Portunus trituberculatus]|uniref:Uncharacterized protein n=1 Tax=Portunus trituberculatus TaxID=210409 RepID=A0A5B7G6Q2_PORTR|nr:hypothetical protein [Portunus trituberculatus]